MKNWRSQGVDVVLMKSLWVGGGVNGGQSLMRVFV